MKKHIIGTIVAMLAVGAHAAESEGQTDQILVKFADSSGSGRTLKAPDLLHLKSGLGSLGFNARHVRSMDSGVHVLKLDRFTSVKALRQGIPGLTKGRADIAYVEPDLIGAAATSDPFYGDQWSLYGATAGSNVLQAWNYSFGSGIIIGVVDTGFTYHEDLYGQTVAGYDFISDAASANDGDGRDGNENDAGDYRAAGQCPSPFQDAKNSGWHGTGVASVAAAGTNNGYGIAGVAPFAKLQSVRVIGKCGAYVSDTADGIRWAAGGAVSGVPQNTTPAKVINVSISGDGACSSVLYSAISAARSMGAVVVIGAGNKNIDVINSWPANCAGAVAVAAINSSGQRWVNGSAGSNYGTGVALAAPGVDMRVASNTGTTTPSTDQYVFVSGTSVAAPMVAGAAALMRSANSNLTPDDIAVILKGTARAFPSACSGCGAGMLDVGAAVYAVRPGAPQGTFTQTYVTRNGSTSTLVLTNTGSGWITGISATCTQPGSSITTPPPSALAPNQSATIFSSNGWSSYTCGFKVTGNSVTNSPFQNGSF